MFSHRSAFETSPNPLTEAVERRLSAGLPLLDLTRTNPTRCGLERREAEEKALSLLGRPLPQGYQPSPRGDVHARRALSQHLSTEMSTISADSLHLVASSSEAYDHLFRLTADPGDTILVPAPSYPLLEHIARWNDIDLQPYPLIEAGGRWKLDFQGLRTALDSRTRAVVVIQPGNPTGSVLWPEEREELGAFCRRWDCALISDEVFADFYPQSDNNAFAALPASCSGWDGCLTFTLGGLSKTLGLPHFKLGWIASSGPRAEEARLRLDVICDDFLSVATPVQAALPGLLQLTRPLGDPVRNRLRESSAALRQALAGSGITTPGLTGGWCALLRCPGLENDEAFAIRLVEEGVLVQPGYLYDFPSEEMIIVSLLTPPEELARGAALVAGALKNGTAGGSAF